MKTSDRERLRNINRYWNGQRGYRLQWSASKMWRMRPAVRRAILTAAEHDIANWRRPAHKSFALAQ